MPERLFTTGAFDPAQAQMLIEVFHAVCVELVKINETFDRKNIAWLIMELAEAGEVNAKRLETQVLAGLGGQ